METQIGSTTSYPLRSMNKNNSGTIGSNSSDLDLRINEIAYARNYVEKKSYQRDFWYIYIWRNWRTETKKPSKNLKKIIKQKEYSVIQNIYVYVEKIIIHLSTKKSLWIQNNKEKFMT